MSSTYNPTEETINSILTGLLPVLIVGLFNGFEDTIEWYQYYSRNEKNERGNNENMEEKKIDERGNDETSINMDDENDNNKNERKGNFKMSIKNLFKTVIKYIKIF
ncbi:hypothetical protein GLOIN_2v1778293 [Rhizophagus irregularis DAOM 181602=DAOM 197198]|uniref:Uncharacterized protein n=1 Tax=Rhizophagus irregularis (strain DAOM 181602 / DAOM 197198 / MUCL 43194) TaxID=747089 RepID=A0A2P4PSM7_RHIID|nr:hypothetical protein GLOIN_2v1778293 [Rhizophagus irregularis DAOM 181602=DAOM 197198]POG68393.1 hypothetical protein GLOIN_2v1778293 [Rhizophagus irregularis DAOM 181602=DAOM 197198]GET49918.1 hypothetical protein GLOIN_2v1778293 [Rhizophagus irregularis DAOM 181602=DAOM 197198]|eukprot:XP_025175259.1 hypothetical protein GLOIN_2v1778293 [Rhizophagus irregularis DAOM 181602=DAOM 197198]